jgi:hypothetical protein
MCFTRDVEKKQLCKEKGITLICIPYWYGISISSGVVLVGWKWY